MARSDKRLAEEKEKQEKELKKFMKDYKSPDAVAAKAASSKAASHKKSAKKGTYIHPPFLQPVSFSTDETTKLEEKVSKMNIE